MIDAAVSFDVTFGRKPPGAQTPISVTASETELKLNITASCSLSENVGVMASATESVESPARKKRRY